MTVRPFWLDLGDTAVIPLVETDRLLIDPAEFFPHIGADRSAWCFRPPWYDVGAGRLVYAIQAFLVVTPDRVLLVDACVGAHKHRGRAEFHQQGEDWFTRFTEAGFSAAEVAAVVFSHLHVDHVGRATRPVNGTPRPVFPRARHYVTEAEFRYWSGPAGAAAMRRTGDYLADSVRPLLEHGLLEFTDPAAVLAPGVELVPAPGHTPGNVCVRVTGSAGALLLVGDVLHHPLQLRHPDWSTRYCVDPALAGVTRRALLAELARSRTPLLPAHFASPSAGRVAPAGEGYDFEPATDLVRYGRYPRR
jgi:glyoxylase-like metal-dependent hydrolase (beta-lactamase superfamily II)